MELIHWCTICATRPAVGMLTVMPKGGVKTDEWPCCQECVDKIDDKDWLDNYLKERPDV